MPPLLLEQLQELEPLADEPEWAAQVPLVHFPSAATFLGGAVGRGVAGWDGLTSPRARGVELSDPRRNATLKASHVFFFAGVAALSRTDAEGDCVLYVRPSAETGASGSASPFDSGALLLPRGAKLNPWCRDKADLPAREQSFGDYCVDLTEWRAVFRLWLSRCYSLPLRYLSTEEDARRSGRPDRSVPRDLCEGDDRRGWTWEVRIEGTVALEHVGVLQVPQAAVRRAVAWKQDRGLNVTVVSYEDEAHIASPDLLCRTSGAIVRQHFLTDLRY